jgi:hypothetical protein
VSLNANRNIIAQQGNTAASIAGIDSQDQHRLHSSAEFCKPLRISYWRLDLRGTLEIEAIGSGVY